MSSSNQLSHHSNNQDPDNYVGGLSGSSKQYQNYQLQQQQQQQGMLTNSFYNTSGNPSASGGGYNQQHSQYIQNNQNSSQPLNSGNSTHQPNYYDPSRMQEEDVLIPIYVDIEYDGMRFREAFCWNVNEQMLTPQAYAKYVAEENRLPVQIQNQIANTI